MRRINMAKTPLQVKLVPYTIDSIVDKTNETPKGVSFLPVNNTFAFYIKTKILYVIFHKKEVGYQ
jgi:hypothetical protein